MITLLLERGGKPLSLFFFLFIFSFFLSGDGQTRVREIFLVPSWRNFKSPLIP